MKVQIVAADWLTLSHIYECTIDTTDLHIYNLDTVPPTDVVWNDVATD